MSVNLFSIYIPSKNLFPTKLITNPIMPNKITRNVVAIRVRANVLVSIESSQESVALVTFGLSRCLCSFKVSQAMSE